MAMADQLVPGSIRTSRLKTLPILRQTQEGRLETVMSNSFGFGGTNATLVFGRV